MLALGWALLLCVGVDFSNPLLPGSVRLDPSVVLSEKTTDFSAALEPIKTDGFDVQVSEAAGFTSNGLNIIVSAEDPGQVEAATEAVVAALADRDELANLQSDLVKAKPEIQITVEPSKAFSVGMTAAQIGGEVRTALNETTVTEVAIEDGVTEVIPADGGMTAW